MNLWVFTLTPFVSCCVLVLGGIERGAQLVGGDSEFFQDSSGIPVLFQPLIVSLLFGRNAFYRLVRRAVGSTGYC
ncbi:MAG: hypothetical protein IIB77_00825 [Proteobacteria bacterium]|nr:hypothetical protein [Pseudomonadota bacterium]